jgi:HlyD family secretion protein
MFRKGYVSSLELEGQRFGVQRSELELASAKTAKDVLEKFTREKTLEDLRSQRDNADAQMKADAAAFDLEKTRLERLEAQLVNCKLVAPQSGMVVYANERSGRFGPSSQSGAIEEGAAVRERQVILRLPDLEKMQVKVNVHESKVDQIRPGMRARIRILDNDLTGAVTTIRNQPEQSSWMSGNVKEYATTVRVVGQSETLRPGMTAEVEILVAHLKDVLTLPVAAAVEQRGKFFCWVDTPAGPEKRPLVLGLSNDQFVEVKDGVAQGELVLLNPRAAVKEARSDDGEEEAIDVGEKFGNAPLGPGPGGPADMQRGDRGGTRGPAGEAGGRRRGRPGADSEGGGMERPRRDGGAGGGRGGGGGGGGGFDLMQFDADGDGKISKDEVPERMQGFFDRLDGNGDGFIDNSEVSAMRRRAQGGGGGGRPGGGGGRPGGGGGGRPGGPPGN